MRFITTITFVIMATSVFADESYDIKAHYTKYEYMIPMSDGVKLYTAVYKPKDDSTTYPFLLMRTPYSCTPYGVDNYPATLRPNNEFAKAGYIFVYQDVRGRWKSEGKFVNMRPHKSDDAKLAPSESKDTYDTIDWLLKNVKGHNGKAGQHGISYPGFYTVCGMIDAHPALKAVSPQAPVTDWFTGDDFHHNGAFFLPHGFNFMINFGKPRSGPTTKNEYMRFEHGTPDGYQFFLDMGPLPNADKQYMNHEVPFWSKLMEHNTFDTFWQERNVRQHIKNIKPAVLTVGGWFDAENLFGALQTYKAIKNDPASTNHNRIVMGPWYHGGWSRSDGESLGNVQFNQKTSPWYRENVELPFFEHFLKGKGEFDLPSAIMFETGTNVWRKYQQWPPEKSVEKSLWLQANQTLSWTAPEVAETSFDEFVSDPAKPVPDTDKVAIGMRREYMVEDQRFAAHRPDVLVYELPVQDKDLTLAGPIDVELTVSTTGSDADWIVKLIDVYPNDFPNPEPNPTNAEMPGYQQLVRGDVMRGKFRNSLSTPEPFRPGEPTVVNFTMNDVNHTFRPGHTLMIQVQSTWFPLVDRNPQTYCDIYNAKESDFKKQTHRLYHDSRITVRVLKP